MDFCVQLHCMAELNNFCANMATQRRHAQHGKLSKVYILRRIDQAYVIFTKKKWKTYNLFFFRTLILTLFSLCFFALSWMTMTKHDSVSFTGGAHC